MDLPRPIGFVLGGGGSLGAIPGSVVTKHQYLFRSSSLDMLIVKPLAEVVHPPADGPEVLGGGTSAKGLLWRSMMRSSGAGFVRSGHGEGCHLRPLRASPGSRSPT